MAVTGERDPAMADEDVFDVIVIGAGPVGETAARVVRGGLTAAVVERRRLVVIGGGPVA